MDLVEFEYTLITKLSALDFVENWDVTRKRTTLKIKVYLKRKSLLNVFYNRVLRIQSFALIINNERVWGIDCDNRLGWHEHPLDNPNNHETIGEHNIDAIISDLKSVWIKIN